MAEGEGTGEGTGAGTGAGTGQNEGLWRAQLPADLKDHELLTPHKTIGETAKAYIETVGKVKDFEGKVKDYETKLTNSIPKLSDKATPEEISAYRKATGVPDKPEGYEFPKIGDVENSPEMVAWAQKTFHNLGLSKIQANAMHKEWSSFVTGMVEAENKMAEEEKVENEKKFRAEFKTEDEYKAGRELTKRFWNKLMGTDFDEAYKEAEAWQVPVFMRALFVIAKKTGEDWSPSSAGGGGEVKPAMIYDKTPSMRGG